MAHGEAAYLHLLFWLRLAAQTLDTEVHLPFDEYPATDTFPISTLSYYYSRILSHKVFHHRLFVCWLWHEFYDQLSRPSRHTPWTSRSHYLETEQWISLQIIWLLFRSNLHSIGWFELSFTGNHTTATPLRYRPSPLFGRFRQLHNITFTQRNHFST